MFVGLVAFLGGLWLSPHALQITMSVTVCWKTTRRRRLPRRALQGLECQFDCWEIPSSFRGNNIYCGHQSIFIGSLSFSLYNIYIYVHTHSFGISGHLSGIYSDIVCLGPGVLHWMWSSRYGSQQLKPTVTTSCKRSTAGAKEESRSRRKSTRKKKRRRTRSCTFVKIKRPSLGRWGTT